MKKSHFFLISILACTTSFVRAAEPLHAPLFSNLGHVHYSVKTTSPQSQRFFDQGLTLFYGFEWPEAIRSFKEAARLDPNCAMCHWGVALATAYKVNAPQTGHEYLDAKTAIQLAQQHESGETPINQALITALALRFHHPEQKTQQHRPFSCHAAAPADAATDQEIAAYRDAMKAITKRYPEDALVNVLL